MAYIIILEKGKMDAPFSRMAKAIRETAELSQDEFGFWKKDEHQTVQETALHVLSLVQTTLMTEYDEYVAGYPSVMSVFELGRLVFLVVNRDTWPRLWSQLDALECAGILEYRGFTSSPPFSFFSTPFWKTSSWKTRKKLKQVNS